jgi:hypothetical protein
MVGSSRAGFPRASCGVLLVTIVSRFAVLGKARIVAMPMDAAILHKGRCI